MIAIPDNCGPFEMLMHKYEARYIDIIQILLSSL